MWPLSGGGCGGGHCPSAHWFGLAEATPAASIETPATAPNAAVAMRMAGAMRRKRVDRTILLVISSPDA
jgi:hypothetical protein